MDGNQEVGIGDGAESDLQQSFWKLVVEPLGNSAAVV